LPPAFELLLPPCPILYSTNQSRPDERQELRRSLGIVGLDGIAAG
jgi:hypothetical protein